MKKAMSSGIRGIGGSRTGEARTVDKWTTSCFPAPMPDGYIRLQRERRHLAMEGCVTRLVDYVRGPLALMALRVVLPAALPAALSLAAARVTGKR